MDVARAVRRLRCVGLDRGYWVVRSSRSVITRGRRNIDAVTWLRWRLGIVSVARRCWGVGSTRRRFIVGIARRLRDVGSLRWCRGVGSIRRRLIVGLGRRLGTVGSLRRRWGVGSGRRRRLGAVGSLRRRFRTIGSFRRRWGVAGIRRFTRVGLRGVAGLGRGDRVVNLGRWASRSIWHIELVFV